MSEVLRSGNTLKNIFPKYCAPQKFSQNIKHKRSIYNILFLFIVLCLISLKTEIYRSLKLC